MKKMLYLSAIGCTALLAASCTNEDVPPGSGDSGMAVFTVRLPEAPGSRSFGDAPANQQLNVAVYEAGKTDKALLRSVNGVSDEGLEIIQFSDNGLTATVKVPLVKNMAYDLVFWSQDKTAHPYTFTENGQTLTVDYGEGNVFPNYADDRDAFFASVSVTSGDAAQSRPVELKRMFAQLNIGTSDLAEYTAAGGSDSFGVSVSGVSNTLDLRTGKVSGTTEILTAGTAPMPSSGTAFPSVNGYTGNLDYLAMAYILVGDGTQNKGNVNVSLYADGKEGFAVYNSVPLQMNYRTNIYGALLTNPEAFNVVIEPGFTGSYDNVWNGETVTVPVPDAQGNYTVSTPEELVGLASLITEENDLKGKTVTLAADIDLGGHEFGGLVGVNDPGSLPYGFAGVFDGGGHTISNFICMERYYMGRPQAYIGFIPVMKEGAQIKNLVLDKVSVGSADTDYSSYGSQRAVVAGLTKGNNVIEKVTVSNSAVYGQSMLGAFVGEDASHGYALELNNCRITNTSVIGTERTALFIGYVYKECFPQITGCTYENSRCVFESYGTSRKSIKLDQYVEYQGQQVHINGDFILQSTNKYLYGTNAVYYNADWKRIPVTIDGVNWTVVYFPFNELP
ncbi:MAG: hypothetical protein J6C59_07700 [Muribaculaceae bacterium]|nr:hypothetical protein [Muribaculaceae bacterium]